MASFNYKIRSETREEGIEMEYFCYAVLGVFLAHTLVDTFIAPISITFKELWKLITNRFYE